MSINKMSGMPDEFTENLKKSVGSIEDIVLGELFKVVSEEYARRHGKEDVNGVITLYQEMIWMNGEATRTKMNLDHNWMGIDGAAFAASLGL